MGIFKTFTFGNEEVQVVHEYVFLGTTFDYNIIALSIEVKKKNCSGKKSYMWFIKQNS